MVGAVLALSTVNYCAAVCLAHLCHLVCTWDRANALMIDVCRFCFPALGVWCGTALYAGPEPSVWVVLLELSCSSIALGVEWRLISAEWRSQMYSVLTYV